MCILDNYDYHSDKLFEFENKDAKNKIKRYLELDKTDISFLSDRKKEKEAFVIEYESENDFNTEIGDTELVVSHISTEAPKVTDTIASLIVSAAKKRILLAFLLLNQVKSVDGEGYQKKVQ